MAIAAFQMSKFQQEQVRRREESARHKVLDISFSDNYIMCVCGADMLAISGPKDLRSESWYRHLREVGQPT